MRTTGTPVGEDVRWTIRDTVKAIKRGLGPAQLKDSFDLELLQPIVPYTRQRTEFHVGQLDAKIDMALIAAWWMLREIEVSVRQSSPSLLEQGVLLSGQLPGPHLQGRHPGQTSAFAGRARSGCAPGNTYATGRQRS